jgi:hypothetical protein
MDGSTRHVLYDPRVQKVLHPNEVERTKSGAHGCDTYWLAPGTYLVAIHDVSNHGIHPCRATCVEVGADGSTSAQPCDKALLPPALVDACPYCFAVEADE